jgi:putative ABC transport system permease protein
VSAVAAVLPPTADPAAPQDVSVTNPTDVLVARAATAAAFEALFITLGAVAMVIGGVGIANVMVIAVLERRSEIGLRRALGARGVHVGAQFVCESALLALAGGLAGAVLGGCATTVYAAARHWYAVVPPQVLVATVAAATGVGAVAGLFPAARAARAAPAEALRSL